MSVRGVTERYQEYLRWSAELVQQEDEAPVFGNYDRPASLAARNMNRSLESRRPCCLIGLASKSNSEENQLLNEEKAARLSRRSSSDDGAIRPAAREPQARANIFELEDLHLLDDFFF